MVDGIGGDEDGGVLGECVHYEHLEHAEGGEVGAFSVLEEEGEDELQSEHRNTHKAPDGDDEREVLGCVAMEHLDERAPQCLQQRRDKLLVGDGIDLTAHPLKYWVELFPVRFCDSQQDPFNFVNLALQEEEARRLRDVEMCHREGDDVGNDASCHHTSPPPTARALVILKCTDQHDSDRQHQCLASAICDPRQHDDHPPASCRRGELCHH
mmetsp:Transcript_36443/g.74820  ORF Transcript_36443/g.74820 Transcript_36443/m.74820 type:complete len:211 (+) Transcript_36443:847-1479(+)